MRISLPPETEIIGKKSRYRTERIICLSERSTTALCKDEQNRRYRLKVFDGESSISRESFRFFEEVKTRGLLTLVDYGEISGHPFFVFNNYNVQDLEQQMISIDYLVNRVIPQISYVLNQIHSKRYLARDISCEHVLFDEKAREILFVGLGNFVKLQGKSTATKENGYGQHYSYIAPEVERYGYSQASDYFSLGVFLLNIIKGTDVFQGMSQKSFYNELNNGRVPGIDIIHLKNTSFDMYSLEDKVNYLILGLMLPDPNQRWGYGEIKCWCNKQMIPLVRNGGRVVYQYSQPMILNGKKYWNDRQIAECVSISDNLWNRDCYNRLCEYLKTNHSDRIGIIDGFRKDDSDKSRIFKTIYTLYPALNGFAWDGRNFRSAQELVESVKNKKLNIDELQTILRNGCLTFYENARKKIGMADNVDIRELQLIENCERISRGDGASKCILLFTPNKQSRYFEVSGKKCFNTIDLINAYNGNGLELKDNSAAIIQNSSFQAWLWAKGYEQLGKEAFNTISADQKNAFPILLTVLEKCSSDEKEKILIRKTFVKYCDLAPIAWLFDNIGCYIDESKLNSELYNRFKNTRMDLNKNILELNQFLSSYVREYQQFVQNTLDNPLVLEFGKNESVSYDFRPVYESGFFCEKWNDMLEVCPAFLYSINGTVDKKKIRTWLSGCGEEQRKILHNKISAISTKDTTDTKGYLSKCRKNFISAVVMLVIAVVLMFAGVNYSVGLAVLSFGLAVIYPILSVNWYHNKKVKAEIWFRTYKKRDDLVSALNSRIKEVGERENNIFDRLLRCENSKCILKKNDVFTDNINLDDPEKLDLSAIQKVLAYLSALGYVLLTTVVLGYMYSSFIVACLYAMIYAVVIPFLFRRKFVNSCFEWSITTGAVAGLSMIGGLIFGRTFLVAMNWLPVGIIVLVVVVFIAIMIISS